MSEQVKGNFPQVKTDTPKKGNASWKPREAAQPVGLDTKNFRYRLVEGRNEHKIAQMIEQGWEVVTALQGEKGYCGPGAERIVDGRPLTSVQGDRDRIYMRLPIEGAKQRDAHYEAKAKQRVKGVVEKAKKEVTSSQNVEMKINGVDVQEIDK